MSRLSVRSAGPPCPHPRPRTSERQQERGGIALSLLIAFTVIAVPGALAAGRLFSTLSLSSQVYTARLEQVYAADAGLEYVYWKLLHDPAFDDDLTSASPSKDVAVDNNGQTATVTVTKDFSGGQALEGQGLALEKEVTPTTAQADVATTYTYTITIKNVGTDTNEIKRVRDLLPPGFDYVAGSTTGLTTANPNISTVDATPSGSDVRSMYLNSGGSPLPWNLQQGSGSAEATITPAQSTWTTLPEYWESSEIGVAGTFVNDNWKHYQWWNTGDGNNKWRWKLQRVRSGNVTDIWTSSDDQISPANQWRLTSKTQSGTVTVEAGDKLRLRLEVYSSESQSDKRHFDYRWGGATSYDSRTERTSFVQEDCEPVYKELLWNLSPAIEIHANEELMLTFQASATKPDGTYYNQAWVRYKPWWGPAEVEVYTPPTAPVTVGSGAPYCGAGLLVSKAVVPINPEAGVPTTFTYTLSIENTTPFFVPLDAIFDLLPPGFVYVLSSSSGLTTANPSETWQSTSERWQLEWDVGGTVGVEGGQTATLVFQADATPEPNADYYNEAWVSWAAGACEGCPGETTQSFSSPTALSQASGIYDLQAVVGGATVRVRLQFWSSTGTLEVQSRQAS